MCGRFTLKTNTSEICRQLAMFPTSSGDPIFSHLLPRYNIAPHNQVLVIRHTVSKKKQTIPTLEFQKMQWGNVFSSPTKKNSIINTRIETLKADQHVQGTSKLQPCLIVADGYYEWKKKEGYKIPYYIYRKNQNLLLFAGIWRSNAPLSRKTQKSLNFCTIITRSSIAPANTIHDRMPAVMEPSAGFHWLTHYQSPKDLHQLLMVYPEDWLTMHAVHTRVNHVGYDDSSCVEPAKFHNQKVLF